jgi:hypothetical protein
VKEAMKINAKLSENEDLTDRMAEMEKKFQKTLAEKNKLEQENKVTNYVK